MYVSQEHGFSIYEPETDAELCGWRPAPLELFQFVKVSRREYWVFHCGVFLGHASHLTYANAWQAVSDENGVCIAPLHSLLECAERLINVAR